MYLAQEVNSEQIKSEFYIDIFERLSKSQETNNKIFIDSAILEAINVANGKSDVFSISNSYYFLVTTLLQKFNSRLIELKSVNSIPQDVYPQILTILR